MTNTPPPPHPDRLPPAERARTKRELDAMVLRGRMAGDAFLDAFSRASTVALAVNDARRKK